MTGLVRKATFFCACGLLAASVAMAHVPDPTKCTCTPVAGNGPPVKYVAGFVPLYIVGFAGTTPSPKGAFRVNVRDANNAPIENSEVIVDFSACGGPSAIQLCTNQLDPNVTADCATPHIRILTDINGNANFHVLGQSKLAP